MRKAPFVTAALVALAFVPAQSRYLPSLATQSLPALVVTTRTTDAGKSNAVATLPQIPVTALAAMGKLIAPVGSVKIDEAQAVSTQIALPKADRIVGTAVPAAPVKTPTQLSVPPSDFVALRRETEAPGLARSALVSIQQIAPVQQAQAVGPRQLNPAAASTLPADSGLGQMPAAISPDRSSLVYIDQISLEEFDYIQANPSSDAQDQYDLQMMDRAAGIAAAIPVDVPEAPAEAQPVLPPSSASSGF